MRHDKTNAQLGSISLVFATLLATSGHRAWSDEKPTLQVIDNPIRVAPIRVAAIGPDQRPITPWYDVSVRSESFSPCSTRLCFDAFEPGLNGEPVGGADCVGFEGARWWFGPTYCNTFATNDFVSEPGDAQVDRIQFAWFWTVEGPGSVEDCYILIQHWCEFDETCKGQDRSDFDGGVLFHFGPLTANKDDPTLGPTYYFADIELCEFGITLGTCDGAQGAYDIIMGKEYDSSSGELTMATCAQPVLWATDRDSPGTSTSIQWDDDNPRDGVHTPIDECYDYSFAICPEDLGSMYCMYCSNDVCITLDASRYPNPGDEEFVRGMAAPGQTVAVAYAMYTQVPVPFRFGPFCGNVGLDASRRSGVIGTTTADRNGNWSMTYVLPIGYPGSLIHFQALGAGTCPDPCHSDVITRIVGLY